MNSLLEVLRTEEFIFHESLLTTLPPKAMYRVLQNVSFVQDIKNALNEGVLGENDIREFANSAIERFKPGQMHPDDMALAAIAVALEEIETDYAHEYINDLASLNVAGFTTSSHVAREIVARKFNV